MSRRSFAPLFCSLVVLAVILSYAQQPETPADIDVYLLIGDANMAGRAEIPNDARGSVDRVFLLNDKNTWEPAREPLNRYSTIGAGDDLRMQGPGFGFAQMMTQADKSPPIGLIVNAAAGTKIGEWLGKSPFYWGARGRSKAAMNQGTLKGVLWLHSDDGGDPKAYTASLGTLISNLRSDLNHASLPVVIAEVPGNKELNTELAKLATSVHAIALVSSDGLTTTADSHLDAKSQNELGSRFAKRMIELQATTAATPKPPSDMKFIDPHVHAMSVTAVGLRAVAQWMDQRNIERCIVSPLNHKGSRPQTDEERETMLANFRPYKGRIDRMTLIDPGEVETVEKAITILEREIADGAVAFGEHYGKDLMFDDPKNLMLYAACEKVGLPVMFHIDQNKNMVDPGMERVDRVLKMFPKCKVVAHAYWWRQLKHADRQLQEHPNLYADMSGSVVVNVLNRDRKFAREFLIRNQDKILWATDEGWWSFGDKNKQMNQHYTFFEELDLPDEVRRKIYRENAIKVYGLKNSD